jgi:hypothetical protein
MRDLLYNSQSVTPEDEGVPFAIYAAIGVVSLVIIGPLIAVCSDCFGSREPPKPLPHPHPRPNYGPPKPAPHSYQDPNYVHYQQYDRDGHGYGPVQPRPSDKAYHVPVPIAPSDPVPARPVVHSGHGPPLQVPPPGMFGM